MPQEERMGFRDPAYSRWHRADSIRRFVNQEEAPKLNMIDVNAALWVEWDLQCRKRAWLFKTGKTATALRG